MTTFPFIVSLIELNCKCSEQAQWQIALVHSLLLCESRKFLIKFMCPFRITIQYCIRLIVKSIQFVCLKINIDHFNLTVAKIKS